jgi:hypothetical protein
LFGSVRAAPVFHRFERASNAPAGLDRRLLTTGLGASFIVYSLKIASKCSVRTLNTQWRLAHSETVSVRELFDPMACRRRLARSRSLGADHKASLRPLTAIAPDRGSCTGVAVSDSAADGNNQNFLEPASQSPPQRLPAPVKWLSPRLQNGVYMRIVNFVQTTEHKRHKRVTPVVIWISGGPNMVYERSAHTSKGLL